MWIEIEKLNDNTPLLHHDVTDFSRLFSASENHSVEFGKWEGFMKGSSY